MSVSTSTPSTGWVRSRETNALIRAHDEPGAAAAQAGARAHTLSKAARAVVIASG